MANVLFIPDTEDTAMLGAVTVTTLVAVKPPTAVETVIVAVPAPTAVTTASLTVATAALLVDQVTAGFVALGGVTVAVSVSEAPTIRLRVV
jgi:hypothetical protein